MRRRGRGNPAAADERQCGRSLVKHNHARRRRRMRKRRRNPSDVRNSKMKKVEYFSTETQTDFPGLHAGGAFKSRQKDAYPGSQLLLLFSLSLYFNESHCSFLSNFLSNFPNHCVSSNSRGDDTSCTIESLQTFEFCFTIYCHQGAAHRCWQLLRCFSSSSSFRSKWNWPSRPTLSDETQRSTPTTRGSWRPFFELVAEDESWALTEIVLGGVFFF